MTRRCAAFGLAVILVLGACTTTEPENEAGDPGPTVSTVAGSDEPVEAATTTTGPPANCPPPGAGGLPTEGQELSEALGDFDGNGSVDQLFVYSSRSGWRMRVVLTSGFGADVEIDARSGRAVGGVPMGAGSDVALAVVGTSGAARRVGLYALRDCQIVPITDPEGDRAVFEVGGSVGEGHGLECRDDRLVAMTARSRDGRTYTTDQVVYRVEGTKLVEERRAEGTTLDNRTAEPLVRLHYELTCGTLGLGPPRPSDRPSDR